MDAAPAFALGVLLALAVPGLAVAQEDDADFILNLRPLTSPDVVTPEGEPAAPWTQSEDTALPYDMVAPESGWRYDEDYGHAYLHFDGVDDVLETSPPVQRGVGMSFFLQFRQVDEPVGDYNVMAMFSTPSDPFAMVVSMDERGRVGFTAAGFSTVFTPESLADGRWHLLFVGFQQDRDGTWRAKMAVDHEEVETILPPQEPTWPAGELGTWWIGGPSLAAQAGGFVGDSFSGDVASVYVAHIAGIDGGTVPPDATPDAEPPVDVAPVARDGVSLVVSPMSGDAVRFSVGLDGASGLMLVAIDETGTEHTIDASAGGPVAWDAPRGPGLYRFEAREQGPEALVVARTQALAMPPPRAPVEIMGAALAATAVVAASSALASRGIDVGKLARDLALGRAEDRFHVATKDRFRAEKALKVGSFVAVVVGVLLMSVILTAGRLRDFEPGAFLGAFLVAGLAVIAFSFALTGAQAAIARFERALPRYRLWLSGALSLALSTFLFGIPFGYTGYLAKERAAAAPAREAAFSAIAGLCVAVAAAPLFLWIGAFTRFAFAEIAVAMALGGVFVSALPIRPLPGRAVWTWSRGASVALLIVAFLLQSAYHLGQLGPWEIVGAGATAAALAAALTVVRTRGASSAPRHAAKARPR